MMGYEHRGQTPLQRIAGKYSINPETGCWEWHYCISDIGYGRVSYLGRLRQAHRVSWLAHRGLIPEGLHVLHKCDVRRCVNPDHLFLGTHQDNMADRDSKGRNNAAKGVQVSCAKLNPEKAFEIRYRAHFGEKQRDLAVAFGVSQRAVAQIIHARTWRQEAHD